MPRWSHWIHYITCNIIRHDDYYSLYSWATGPNGTQLSASTTCIFSNVSKCSSSPLSLSMAGRGKITKKYQYHERNKTCHIDHAGYTSSLHLIEKIRV